MNNFSSNILAWYEKHGRHDLPWQKNKSLYSVWVSEIMLQQTQVATVIPYYQKFMQSFPDLSSLANASDDKVMSHWAGLGYYSRARNLHKAAKMVVDDYEGRFPEIYEDVLTLPGIGPSTAAAVLAQALNQSHTILDGNVKRVLARYHAIEGWPGQRLIEQSLWQKAKEHTPEKQAADYTQAIMDMGATVCTRSKPKCLQCPLNENCLALEWGKVEVLPSKRPKKTIPVRQKRFLFIVQGDNNVLMEKRPSSGIWGGLWSLPELDLDDDITQMCQQRWGLNVEAVANQPVFRHTFSHFHLDITPCLVKVGPSIPQSINEVTRLQWCGFDTQLAVATPVRHILDEVVEKALI